jgi:hypothetical protein
LLASETTVPRAIGRLIDDTLTHAGLTTHVAEQFVPIWEEWIRAERQGLINVVAWDRPLPVLQALQDDQLDREADLLTDDGRDAYQGIVRLLNDGDFNKSDALTLLIRPDLSQQTGYARDCSTILTWYERGRARAIARQHRAAFGYDDQPIFAGTAEAHYRGLAQLAEPPALTSNLTIDLPSDFRRVVGSMEPSEFGRLFSQYADEFRALWQDPTVRNARRMCQVVYDGAPGSKPTLTPPERAVRVFGQLLGAGGVEALAGPWAGLAMLLASEGALHVPDALRRRGSVRGVVEYYQERLQ